LQTLLADIEVALPTAPALEPLALIEASQPAEADTEVRPRIAIPAVDLAFLVRLDRVRVKVDGYLALRDIHLLPFFRLE